MFLIIIFILFLIILLFYCLQDQGLYHPYPKFSDITENLKKNLNMERVWLLTKDNILIFSLLFIKSNSFPTLIYFHGNKGNITQRIEAIQKLMNSMDLNIFLVEYRGFGLSEGSPSEKGLKIDSQTALDYLLKLESLTNKNFFVFGRGLGAAVAIDLVSKNEEKIKGLIVEAPFTSVPKLFSHSSNLFRFVPNFLFRTKWDNSKLIPEITTPILFLSSSDELFIPPKMTKELYQSAKKSKETIFYIFQNEKSETAWRKQNYDTLIKDFISNYSQSNSQSDGDIEISYESDDDDDEFFLQKFDWSDVTPIPQDEDPSKNLSPISYSSEFAITMDYFRAIWKSQEISERALELTKQMIKLNPANYSVWGYRRFLLDKMGKNLKDELVFISDIISLATKNYQIWRHRRLVCEKLNYPNEEKAFIDSALKMDEKNYHAWEYRLWVIENFDLWDNELEFIENMISKDIRNNSAWNARFFIVTKKQTIQTTPEIQQREIDFCLQKLAKVDDNESAWNYLNHFILNNQIKKEKMDFYLVKIEEFHSKNPKNRFPLIVLFHIFSDKKSVYFSKENLLRAQQIAKDLSENLDQIRCYFWNYKQKFLAKLLENF
ncbi:protein farnesyltransferase/geranylgeranyltransferase type-1 subunit alpha [Anaeramoeba ignava]|uniref:Protein farnesyltransferase/geranylgeranyltransferase type-1 subunit alpha n=1 Tax=Anaeramoeba ignava TaxID=1746090 RepID=A0A9Q0LQ30_ANAIG|nr:protein farnesyltransferase/geranylgeranyltransferase type-1 subunit alpha [Anaeramoeba ignava]